MPVSFLVCRRDGFARSADGWQIPSDRLRLLADQSQRNLDCPTQLALERWSLRHLGSIAHERRVAELVTDLFDVTRSRHGLGPEDLRLLRWAAAIHDVGRAICDETHPAQGVRMLRADRSLPLSATDRRLLAYLTLYHRGRVPAAGEDQVLNRSDDAHRMLLVLALLRAADGLDNRSLHREAANPAQIVFGLTERVQHPATLHITCQTTTMCTKMRRVYERRKKFRLLEDVLHCQVETRLIEAAHSRAVA